MRVSSIWDRVCTLLRTAAASRIALAIGVIVSLAVPLWTLPRLPHVSWWPLLLGLVPWVIGKYVLCGLRWHAVTRDPLSRGWHLRANAEGELLGLLTPGHVGADLWRIRRLTAVGKTRPDALVSVGIDRLAGAAGLIVFAAFAGTALPAWLVIGVGSAVVLASVTWLVVARWRPGLLPASPLPSRRKLLEALALSAGYQMSVVVLLLGTLAATGHELSPLALVGAFGASQLAGAVPGPNGASPRDGALVVALVSMGVPWLAAATAVTLKAALAWLPALTLGGLSFLLARRARTALSPAT